jgi:hypothetical protein
MGIPGWLNRWQQIHNIALFNESGWPQLRMLRFAIYMVRCLRMSSRMLFRGYGWDFMISKWPRWIESAWRASNYWQEEWPQLYITKSWW